MSSWVGQRYLNVRRVAPYIALREAGKVDIRLHRRVDWYRHLALAERQRHVVVVAEELALEGELVVVGYHLVDVILRGV